MIAARSPATRTSLAHASASVAGPSAWCRPPLLACLAGVFPDGTHERVTYPFAVVWAAGTPGARALLQFLSGPEAQAIFTRRNFMAAE